MKNYCKFFCEYHTHAQISIQHRFVPDLLLCIIYLNVIRNVIINRMYGAIFLCLHAHYKAKHAVPLSPTPTRALHLYTRLSRSVKNCNIILDLVFRILFIIQFFWHSFRSLCLALVSAHFICIFCHTYRLFVVGCFYKMLHLMFRHFLLFVCANEHFNELFSAEREMSRNYYLKLESSLQII